jgi:hypothetical protein
VARPRQNSKGPNKGEIVGGVCPELVLCAVNRMSRLNRASRIERRVEGRLGRKVEKCFGG